MVTLVWRTDLHLADEAPASRTDDWASSLLNKLTQIGDIARAERAQAVLDGGDFFHLKSPSRNSHDLVRRAAEVHAAYPCPVYANVGNHDVKYGALEYLNESPLEVLFASGVFRRLYDEHEAVFEEGGVKVRVVGIPYHGTKYDTNRLTSLVKGDEDYLVVIAHLLASPGGGSMFEAEDIVGYPELANLGADVWCFLPGTKISDWMGRQVDIERVSKTLALHGRSNPVTIEDVHPVRMVDEEVVRLDVEGVPSDLIPGVTLEHPFWVARGMQCRLPSRASCRCHPDKPMGSYPCRTCISQPPVQPEWVRAGEIVAGDYVAVPVPQIPSDPRSSPGLARLLGLYLAEGHLIENRNGEPVAGVGWSFHENETHLHADVERLVREHFGLEVKRYPHPERHCMQVCAYGREVADFFRTHGGRYSDGKSLSSWVWGLSASDRKELLVGWLEGDGHARSSGRYGRLRADVTGVTVSADLASQMYLMALSVGLRPYYTIRPSGESVFHKGTVGERRSKTLPVHVISFYGEDADFLASRLGVEVLERSKTKVAGFFHEGLYYVRVRAVDRFHYKGPVYNMRTSTQEYVAGFLLTHNCFGHWHKNQGIQELASGKWVVNIGSLSRGALTQDEMERVPSVAVMSFRKEGIEIREVPLRVTPADQVFDVAGRQRQETRAASVDALVDSIKDTVGARDEGSLLESVRTRGDIPEAVRERTVEYLERAKAK